MERPIVDESKTKKVKIGVLVLLGIVCLAVAVPRFMSVRKPAAKPAPSDKAAKPAISKRIESGQQDQAKKGTMVPYPVDVGEEVVKDPFSPAQMAIKILEDTPPPPDNPFEGQDFTKKDFPWDNTQPVTIRPPNGMSTGGPGPVTQPVNTGPSLRLTGVLKGPKDVAIIRTDVGRYYAGVGDVLGGGYRVVSIARDRVTLSGPAGTKVLVLGRS